MLIQANRNEPSLQASYTYVVQQIARQRMVLLPGATVAVPAFGTQTQTFADIEINTPTRKS